MASPRDLLAAAIAAQAKADSWPEDWKAAQIEANCAAANCPLAELAELLEADLWLEEVRNFYSDEEIALQIFDDQITSDGWIELAILEEAAWLARQQALAALEVDHG